MAAPNPAPNYATDLHKLYDEIASRPMKLLTVDERRGVDFYLADIGRSMEAPATTMNWIAFVHELDRFVVENGRMPRADSTRPRPATLEQTLVDRLAYQRRWSVRAAHCSYQKLRLEVIPDFRWDPQQERWDDQLEQHQHFWASNGRAPRRDAADPAERALARWVAQQRAALRDRSLPPARARRLRQANFRVL